MDSPYDISDLAFASRWDQESGSDLVEKAGQGSCADKERSQAERGKDRIPLGLGVGLTRPVTAYRGRDRNMRPLDEGWCQKQEYVSSTARGNGRKANPAAEV